jgi:hypothetical protein
MGTARDRAPHRTPYTVWLIYSPRAPVLPILPSPSSHPRRLHALQGRLDHKTVTTTLISTPIQNQGKTGVRNPVDSLWPV